ncbi:MAG: TRAP transporter small permease [Spirochaetales bacterium]
MGIVVKVFELFHRFIVGLAKVLLVAMTIIISINVFMRYVLNSGIRWSEEIALVLVVWFTFLSMAMGVKNHLHIHLNLLPSSLPSWLNTLLVKLENLLMLGCGIVFLVYGGILTKFTLQSILPGTGLPAGVLYVVMPIASIPIIYDSVRELFSKGSEDSHA